MSDLQSKLRPIEDVTKQAIQILIRELGAGDAARFLAQYQTVKGNWTEDRHEILDSISKEEYEADLAKIRQERKERMAVAG